MEYLILGLLVLSAVGAWCLFSCPRKAHDKVIRDVQ